MGSIHLIGDVLSVLNPLKHDLSNALLVHPPSATLLTRSVWDRGMSEKWDGRFLSLATHISGWSKDPSTKVGCVVVGPDREIRSTGFNGFPQGIADTDERLSDRNLKYPLICHAEENAIMHAARDGASPSKIVQPM